MLGIYARTFMTAAGLDPKSDRPVQELRIRPAKPAVQRRWKAPGYWIDPPEEF